MRQDLFVRFDLIQCELNGFGFEKIDLFNKCVNSIRFAN